MEQPSGRAIDFTIATERRGKAMLHWCCSGWNANAVCTGVFIRESSVLSMPDKKASTAVTTIRSAVEPAWTATSCG
jgi:hypothetical protein